MCHPTMYSWNCSSANTAKYATGATERKFRDEEVEVNRFRNGLSRFNDGLNWSFRWTLLVIIIPRGAIQDRYRTWWSFCLVHLILRMKYCDEQLATVRTLKVRWRMSILWVSLFPDSWKKRDVWWDSLFWKSGKMKRQLKFLSTCSNWDYWE